MRNIKVVIGAGFGDEGKGLMTNYFCENFEKNSKVLNIRYNGTGQAGHGVELSNGVRHVFKHLGAGSFNSNVDTYLASTFYVHPIIFLEEYAKLNDMGLFPNVYVNKFSNIILPWDGMLNMLVEETRGDAKHGSCGVGLFEAVKRSETAFKFNISDIFYSGGVRDKLFAIRDCYYGIRFKELGVDISNSKYNKMWYSEDLINNFESDLYEMIEIMHACNENKITEYENIVFEGAQGLLLDWGNREYMPYLTASYTGLNNVKKILEKQKILENSNIEVCYVTRSYMTRHGAGYFNSEVSNSEELCGKLLIDKTNSYNEWQGNFRYGFLDVELLQKHIKKDIDYLVKQNNTTYTLAVTHLDETDGVLLTTLGKQGVDILNITDNNIYLRYLSYSAVSKNIRRIYT